MAIAVFGSADPTPGDPLWEEAEHLGEALARAGFGVVNGGYGGTMEATARGARNAGGHVTGVPVKTFGRTPNRYTEETILAGSLMERLRILIDRSDGYVVLPGATGTLVEFALVWEYARKSLQRNKPIVLLGDFWVPVVERIVRPEREGPERIREWPRELHLVRTVNDAIGVLRSQLMQKTE